MTASLLLQRVLMQQVPIAPDIPDNLIPIVGIVFGTIMIMVIMTPIIRAIIRAVERRAAAPPTATLSPELSARLDRIEQAVDAIAVEIERVAESQRFLAKLQTEPRALGAPPPPR